MSFFFPYTFRAMLLGASLMIPQLSWAQFLQLESTCGISDDAFYVNSFKANAGVPLRLVLQRKSAVGAIAVNANAGIGPKFCSGTLISPDLFLTAAHCADAFVATNYVSMNFEYKPDEMNLLPEEFYEVESVLEDGFQMSPELDYMIVKLKGKPGDIYGYTPLRSLAPLVGERVTIIQHPEGLPKKVHIGTVSAISDEQIRYGNLDTQGGSSGSGVLDMDGYLVGVHIQGGCSASGGANRAVSLEAIRRASPIIRSILGESTN
jgi:V8-like Glu-specific endopeptidase